MSAPVLSVYEQWTKEKAEKEADHSFFRMVML